jgi:hypothetical protein
LLPLDPEYQAKAEATLWTWPDSPATLQDCIARHLRDYDVLVGESPSPWEPLNIVIRSKDGDREVYFRGHQGTVLTRWQYTLFLADFSPIRAGCMVRAIDLRTGEEAWKTHLKATSCPGHSMYRNRVTLENDGQVVTVHGDEAYARYIEFVDCRTGRTLGHMEYENR